MSSAKEYLELIASYDDYIQYCRENVPKDATAFDWTVQYGHQISKKDKRPKIFNTWCYLASYPHKLSLFYQEKDINYVAIVFQFIYFSIDEKRNTQGFNENIAKVSLFIPNDMLYVKVTDGRIHETFTTTKDTSLLSRWRVLKKHYEHWSSFGRQNKEFFVALHDGIDHNVYNPLNIEILTFGKNKFLPYTLIPDIYYLTRNGYKDSKIDILPWVQKKNVMFWRGSSTGGNISWDNWKTIPRIRLVMMSNETPDTLDAKITDVVQIKDNTKGLKEYLEHKGFVSDRIPFTEFHRYKYLINIDGNSCAWDSMFLKLKSNSVVFHVDNDNIQWYYDRLIPWKHYIPIKPDLSDLYLKYKWALSNDDIVRQIAHESSEFMLSL